MTVKLKIPAPAVWKKGDPLLASKLQRNSDAISALARQAQVGSAQTSAPPPGNVQEEAARDGGEVAGSGAAVTWAFVSRTTAETTITIYDPDDAEIGTATAERVTSITLRDENGVLRTLELE